MAEVIRESRELQLQVITVVERHVHAAGESCDTLRSIRPQSAQSLPQWTVEMKRVVEGEVIRPEGSKAVRNILGKGRPRYQQRSASVCRRH